jgi:Cu+-exporting ATPase
LTSPGNGTTAWRGEPLSAAEEQALHSMTRHSAHPLASRIAELTRGNRMEPVRGFVETPGRGMEGIVAGSRIWMGSEVWLQSRGAANPADDSINGHQGRAPSIDGQVPGQSSRPRSEHRPPPARDSSVHVAIDGRWRGCFVLENKLRAEVETLLPRLRETRNLVLLSGDHASESERFQRLLGTTARVAFNQTPFDKLNVIRELQEAGHKVMMVGDGLNDAGALRQADTGVAVVEQVGTFSPASDVILEAAQLPRLAEVLAFSRDAAREVRAGFVVSGVYNVAGVSIAAAGFLSPLVCAILMPLSSVTVVLVAIGATRWRARRTFTGVHRPRGKARRSAIDRMPLLTPAVAKKGLS